MAGYDDEDDWVGTPPEGHYTRDRARPDFWRNRWQAGAAMGLLGVIVIIAVVIALTR